MKREQKAEVVENLGEIFQENKNFYIVDSSRLTVNQINDFRRLCFNEGIKIQVVKNTLIRKALERAEINEDMSEILKGASSIMISENMSAPAKLIKEYRKKNDKPVLKAAYIQESLYIGDDSLDSLLKIKSREQLIGEVIGMLQSPMQNVISGLKGQGGKIAGILKTLSEKES
jgi:large subunit ribosomal protein L10